MQPVSSGLGAPAEVGIFENGSTPVPAETSPARRAFQAWGESTGLVGEIRFLEERVGPGGRRTVLLRDNATLHLDDDLSEAAALAHLLHLKAFYAILGALPDKPENFELQVIVDRGFCDLGHELYRIRLKADSILYDRVDRPGPEISCMLDFEYIQQKTKEVSNKIQKTKQAASSVTSVQSTTNIHSFITSYYKKKNARVSTTTLSPSLLSMTVFGLKREIIDDQSYWEKIQIVIRPASSNAPGVLMLDGRYGAGLTAPPETALRDMEPAFTAKLINYGKSLSSALGNIQ
jgi:hypothetical protein